MQYRADEVVVSLPFKLLRRDFVEIIVLVHEQVVKCQCKTRGNDASHANDVNG